MTAPKNDKARKEWLAGLKPGGEAMAVDEVGSVLFYGTVILSNRGQGWHLGGRYFTKATGKEIGRKSQLSWLASPTKEGRETHRKAVRVRECRGKLSAVGYYGWMGIEKKFTDAQILAVSAILWPESGKEPGQ